MEAIDWGSLTLGRSIHHQWGEHHLASLRVQVQFDSTQDCQPQDFLQFKIQNLRWALFIFHSDDWSQNLVTLRIPT